MNAKREGRMRLIGAASITLDQKIERIHRDDFSEIAGDWMKVNRDLSQAISKAKRSRERAAA